MVFSQRVFSFLFCLTLISFDSSAKTQDQKPKPPTPVAQVILDNFDRWDTDHKGTLTLSKVRAASLDDKNKDEAAAALAAIIYWYQQAPKLGDVPKAFFNTYKPRAYPPIPADIGQQDRIRITEERLETGPMLQGAYYNCLHRIRSGPYPIFGPDGPKWTDVHQGAIGDCGFIAPLGALVHRDPNEVRRIIQITPTGYNIKFPDEVTLEMKALTDTQIGLLESDISHGLWPRILELAYFARPKVRILNRAGQPILYEAPPIEALTSFSGKQILLVNGYANNVPADKLEALVSQIREELRTAMAYHKLVGVGSAHDGPMAFGLPGYHAFAIFDFDAATDVVTIWNPWGDNYRPRAPGEVERVSGVFKLPLVDLVRAFRIIGFETNELYYHSAN